MTSFLILNLIFQSYCTAQILLWNACRAHCRRRH